MRAGRVEPEPDGQAEDDHDAEGEDASGEVRQGPSREHRRPGHGQAAEAVEDSALDVRRQADGRRHAADEGRLQEDGGDDEVDVVDPGIEMAPPRT